MPWLWERGASNCWNWIYRGFALLKPHQIALGYSPDKICACHRLWQKFQSFGENFGLSAHAGAGKGSWECSVGKQSRSCWESCGYGSRLGVKFGLFSLSQRDPGPGVPRLWDWDKFSAQNSQSDTAKFLQESSSVWGGACSDTDFRAVLKSCIPEPRWGKGQTQTWKGRKGRRIQGIYPSMQELGRINPERIKRGQGHRGWQNHF